MPKALASWEVRMRWPIRRAPFSIAATPACVAWKGRPTSKEGNPRILDAKMGQVQVFDGETLVFWGYPRSLRENHIVCETRTPPEQRHVEATEVQWPWRNSIRSQPRTSKKLGGYRLEIFLAKTTTIAAPDRVSPNNPCRGTSGLGTKNPHFS